MQHNICVVTCMLKLVVMQIAADCSCSLQSSLCCLLLDCPLNSDHIASSVCGQYQYMYTFMYQGVYLPNGLLHCFFVASSHFLKLTMYNLYHYWTSNISLLQPSPPHIYNIQLYTTTADYHHAVQLLECLCIYGWSYLWLYSGWRKNSTSECCIVYILYYKLYYDS